MALWLADRLPERRQMESLSWVEAAGIGVAGIGVAQALALAPGTSRAGITITAGRLVGLTRDAAARFSFLMLAPVVAGATIFKGADVVRDGLPPGSTGPFLVGSVAAAVSGFAAIWVLLRYVRTHSYDVFVVYRLIAGAVVLLLIASGVKPATF